MADDSTINIQFTSDTTGFQTGADQVQVSITNVNSAIASTGKAAQDATPPVGALFTTMEKSSDTAIKGIIKGTETWQQAMLNVITDLEVKLAQMALNDVLNWARNQASKLASTISTNASMVAANDAKNASITASDTAAASVSSGANASKLISQIGSDAAAAYSGVFANLSPVLGPAAAVPAAAAYAAVAAMEGLVSLDVGAWNLGSDTVAQLHQGEMVIPQNFAQGLRDGGGFGGGGGDNYTININAIDTQTGTQFLRNNASQIASIISGQVRNFNGNIPAWKS